MSLLAATPPAKPLGFLKTVGLVAGVFVAGQVIQIAFALAMRASGHLNPFDGGTSAFDFDDGLVVGLALLLSVPVQIAMVCLAAGKSGRDFRNVLALRGLPALHTAVIAGVMLAAVDFGSDFIGQAAGRPIVPAYQVDLYLSAAANGSILGVLLLWASFVIAAPVIEELLFRGIAYSGFRSRLGPTAAMTLATLIWTVLHTQYDMFDLACVAATGAVLGWSRIASGTIVLPIVLHMTTNFHATYQTAATIGWPT